jgi:hypothetical protein
LQQGNQSPGEFLHGLQEGYQRLRLASFVYCERGADLLPVDVLAMRRCHRHRHSNVGLRGCSPVLQYRILLGVEGVSEVEEIFGFLLLREKTPKEPPKSSA